MRKLLSVALLLPVVALAGCASPFGKSHCGWSFQCGCPEYVDVDSSVLVHPGQMTATAQAMGNVAGPVLGGTYTHGAAPVYLPPPALAAPCVSATLPMPAPVVQRDPKTLTCEEWCALMRQAKQRADLVPPARMPEGKEEE
jgi:hypothetical protein